MCENALFSEKLFTQIRMLPARSLVATNTFHDYIWGWLGEVTIIHVIYLQVRATEQRQGHFFIHSFSLVAIVVGFKLYAYLRRTRVSMRARWECACGQANEINTHTSLSALPIWQLTVSATIKTGQVPAGKKNVLALLAFPWQRKWWKSYKASIKLTSDLLRQFCELKVLAFEK